MAHMKAKEKKPKSRNGITCMSIASSTFNEKSVATPVTTSQEEEKHYVFDSKRERGFRREYFWYCLE
jgi:hypothetical protein